jgi:methyl-accepting chemotaxis protein
LLHVALLLLTLAVGGWLVSGSVENTVLRADRAEELAAAERQIADQSRLLAEQKARLEAGIAEILETHRSVAAGDFSARAPLQEDNELWQIAHSLNTLIARYSTLARESRELSQTREEIEQVAHAIEHARLSQRAQFPQCHTPLAQRILMALGAR